MEIQSNKFTYTGINFNPTTIKIQSEHTKEKSNELAVISATPLVPSLKPKKPEQILLNKGKNTIRLIIYLKIIIS